MNSVSKGDAISALAYAIAVLIIWGIGAIRRMNDTRTFSRIYAKLAVSVILNDENRSQDVSITQARANLSREFVDFFEEHFPVFFTSAISIIGVTIALLFLEPYVGITAIIEIAILSALLPRFTRKNDYLYSRLNNRLEK